MKRNQPVPANYGGGVSPYPWSIPLVFQNVATKPELQGHFEPVYPDVNLKFPDQLRVNEFITHFQIWVKERQQGKDTMLSFVMLRLPNDHTAGTRAGSPTPKASVADNDLAVGRAVEAVSHSPYFCGRTPWARSPCRGWFCLLTRQEAARMTMTTEARQGFSGSGSVASPA
jgi:hypothetical protein